MQYEALIRKYTSKLAKIVHDSGYEPIVGMTMEDALAAAFPTNNPYEIRLYIITEWLEELADDWLSIDSPYEEWDERFKQRVTRMSDVVYDIVSQEMAWVTT